MASEQVLWPISASPPGMTGRTFFAMLFFAGIIAFVMWLFILPALTTYRPTLP